jgi:putrescine transport system substrate-binding protein
MIDMSILLFLKMKLISRFFSFFFLFLAFFSATNNFLCAQKSKSEEAKIVYVYNWADYIPASVIEAFEKETGIKVIYDSFDSLETLETKLFMKSSYDVVFPSAWPQFARGIEAKLFQPLNYQWLPQAKGLSADLLEKIASIPHASVYGVPYLWGTTGLGFDLESVLEKVPEKFLESWGLIFDPENAKKLKELHIQILDNPTDVMQAVMLYLGEDPSKEDRKSWEKAVNLLIKIRPYITYFENTRQIEALVQGQSQLIQGFSTYVNMAKQEKKNRRIQFVIPKEGAIAWFDMMAIPQKAKHRRNAHHFINFLLQPKIMAQISNLIRAANPIPASYSMIDDSLIKDPMVFPNAETLKRIYPDRAFSLSFQRWLSRAWLKIKLRYGF